MAKPIKIFDNGSGSGHGHGHLSTTDTLTTTDAGAILGTSHDDLLVGTDGADTILGFEGNDTLVGGAGYNTMDGGEGSDTYLVYGYGNVNSITDTGSAADHDVIAAGTSSMAITLDSFGPASGVEEITASGYAYVDVYGTGGDDTLDFSQTTLDGIQVVNAMGGNDTVIGSDGDDNIAGGSGNDSLAGGDGADTLQGGSGADAFVMSQGDTGVDTITDFNAAYGDTIDLTSYGATGEVESWSLTDVTPDDGVDDPVLSILWKNGEKTDVAVLQGVTQDDMDADGFDQSFVMF